MLRFKPTNPEIAWRVGAIDDGWHGIHNPFVCHLSGGSKPAGSTTQTTTSQPWATQQPYLTSGFSAAQNLLNSPAPTQANPVAPLNGTENAALSGITNLAADGTPITGAATGFDTNLENGSYLANNPSTGYFQSLAGSNLGLSNPGASILQGIGSANPAASGPGNSTLSSISGKNVGVNNLGTPTLAGYANGKMFSNGYSDDTAKSVMASVVPEIEAQFAKGNSLNNPAAAYATTQGATAALAPIEYQNYQTQEQLQQNAANTLGTNAIAGANLSANAANDLNSSYLTGAGLQEGAGSALESGALAGGNLQATAASGLGSNYTSGVNSMVQGNALAPQNQSLSYADLEQMLGAGTAQQTQTQNEASGAAATSNFAQMSPYQQLAAYMQAVGGNYGQSSATSTPYFQNGTANTLSGLTGIASLGSALGGASGIASGLGSIASFAGPLLAML